MRARVNAAPRRATTPKNGGGAAAKIIHEEIDCNGKDKPKFKRPPMAAFKLPPPPEITSISVRDDATSNDNLLSKANAAATNSNLVVNGSNNPNNGIVNSHVAPASSPPVPSAHPPPSPLSTSAVYQRVKRNPQKSENGGGAAAKIIREEIDCNGEDKPKFKRPPMAAFKLPPPPEIASLSVRDDPTSNDNLLTKANAAAANSNLVVNGSNNPYNGIVKSHGAPASSPPVPSAYFPPPPPSTSAVHQRVKRNLQNSDANKATSTATSSKASASSGSNKIAPTSLSRDSYSNSYNPVQQYQNSSNYSKISHPYQQTSWYATARNNRRRRQKLMKVLGAVMAIILFVGVWCRHQQHPHRNLVVKKHHKNYHHHEHHHGFRSMIGSVESPIGLAEESSRKEMKSYRQLEQEHSSHVQSAEEGQEKVTKKSQSDHMNNDMQVLFSNVPVTHLSNQRLLPYVGFGVSSRSVEHKQVPIIVSTLLQYASSETEGGGGIALIDAVIDEDRKLEKNGGSLIYSISNKMVEWYEEEEEKLESSKAKIVVTLVGRAISFFGKENLLHRQQGSEGALQSVKSGSVEDDTSYDYENRLEVHLLVGLSGSDLGAQNTIAALRELVAELDGLIPPFPKDLLHMDVSDWKTQPSSPAMVDHHVDVRLHVLLRLNHCHIHPVKVAPCSSDEAKNKELLEKWIGSYDVLEKLYEANIIHGIGLDGMHGKDIQYLLRNCKIKPQLYRGDVSQALDIYGRRIGNSKDEHISRILRENNVTFLASNVAGHILERKAMAPNAYSLLQNLGGVLYRAHHETLTAPADEVSMVGGRGHKGEGQYYTVPRLVLSFLVRHKVCVLPHAYKAAHLADDAPESVGGLANFLSERRVAEIGAALRALLSESDLPEDHGLGMEGEKQVAAVFHNLMEKEVHLFWLDKNEEVALSPVKSSGSAVVIANTGDRFGAYGAHGEKLGTYRVSMGGGSAEDFTIPSADSFPS